MEKIRVYYNLHRKCFSIQRHIKGKGWRIWGHADSIMLYDPKFLVKQRGRKRVLQTHQKNVHAYIEGFHVVNPKTAVCDHLKATAQPVIYNPYKFSSFVRTVDFKPIYKAEVAMLNNAQGYPSIAVL